MAVTTSFTASSKSQALLTSLSTWVLVVQLVGQLDQDQCGLSKGRSRSSLHGIAGGQLPLPTSPLLLIRRPHPIGIAWTFLHAALCDHRCDERVHGRARATREIHRPIPRAAPRDYGRCCRSHRRNSRLLAPTALQNLLIWSVGVIFCLLSSIPFPTPLAACFPRFMPFSAVVRCYPPMSREPVRLVSLFSLATKVSRTNHLACDVSNLLVFSGGGGLARWWS